MYIKKIVIEKNAKTIESYIFNKRLSVVSGGIELRNIIKLLLGRHDATEIFCDVRFYAEVWLDKAYYIRGKKSKNDVFYNLSVFCDGIEKDCGEEYFKAVRQNNEMDEAHFFNHFKRQDYTQRLKRYNDILKNNPNGEFSSKTDGYGSTRSFRVFIADYIKHFEPIHIRSDKDLYLKLSSEGEFTVGRLNNDENICLSEGENTLYHFLSFISVADFWDKAEEIRNMNRIKKPLVIFTFLERLDESIDISDILRKTNSLRRQTILFALNEHKPTKYDI